jgi:hypothetical protein
MLALCTTVAYADVILPAFAGPYVTLGLFPVAIAVILGSEALIYRVMCPKLATRDLISLVLIANLVSSVAGIALAVYLPSGLVMGRHVAETGPEFQRYFIWGFVLAYLLSIALEAGVLGLAARRLPIGKPIATSAVANTASYILLVGIAWFEQH